jgi:hypothetical protein
VPALPPAGSPDDDGTGFLATLSARGVRVSPGARAGDPDTGARAADAPRRPAARFGEYRFDTAGNDAAAPPPYAAGYSPLPGVERAGAIVGSVRWTRPPAPAPTPPGRRGCPGARLGELAGTVVHLEGIALGRSWAGGGRGQLGGVLEVSRCGLVPSVQLLAPIGASITIANQDRGPRRVIAVYEGALAGASPSSAGAPLRSRIDAEVGPGAVIEIGLRVPGWWRFALADDPDGAAWVVVPPHPYVAIADERGGFRLDEVPPGVHQLVAGRAPLGEHAPGRPASASARAQVAVHGHRVTHATLTLGGGAR